MRGRSIGRGILEVFGDSPRRVVAEAVASVVLEVVGGSQNLGVRAPPRRAIIID
eukprot:COSAG01_NODE_1554_length_9930_cov_19.371478_8_plen_54_part_00